MTTTVSDEALEEVLRLDREATPGPWTNGNTEKADYQDVQGPERKGRHDGGPGDFDFVVIAHADYDEYPTRREAKATMDLIAHYRNVTPELAREVRRLREENGRLDEELQQADEAAGYDGNREGLPAAIRRLQRLLDITRQCKDAAPSMQAAVDLINAREDSRKLRARLASAERVVEAVRAWRFAEDAYDAGRKLDAMVQESRAHDAQAKEQET